MNFHRQNETNASKGQSLPPKEKDFSDWGGVPEFIRVYPTLEANSEANSEIEQLHRSLVEHSSVCSFCGVGCPYGVVRDSHDKQKVVPLSRLGLCVKGATSLLTGGDAERKQRLQRRGRESDRIRTPMIRNHDGSWKKVSWEEALDRAAWLFLHIREWVGPQGVAIYGNGQKTIEAIWMASLYKHVFKIPTIGANSEHCLASAGAAHELNFGNEASFTWKEFEELELCDVAILHGTNPVVTFPQAYKKLKGNTKAVKVVIDPIESDTVIDLRESGHPTLHIRFEQGGDALFNLAVVRVILENGWEDREFLEKAVDPDSLRELRDLCFEDRCTPENVARQIALAEDDPTELAQTIRTYAALIAKPNAEGYRPKPAFVSSMGINQSTGSYGFSTNLNLLLLAGNVGRKGAGSLRIAGQSNATSELMLGFNARRLLFNLDATNPEHRRELAEVLEIPEHNIPDAPGTPVSRMSDDDYLYCFIFMGTQFTRNMPRLGKWLKRLGRSFNIVIDSFLPEGALEYADVLLPALTYTERLGVIQRGDRTLQLQQPLTAAPPLAWADEQILARLALAISQRLRDPDTATLNDLDPDVVAKTFGCYLDKEGRIDSARVFDRVVETSCRLKVYNRLVDAEGTPISHAMLREKAGLGVQWQGDGRYTEAKTQGDVFPRLRYEDRSRARLVRPPEKFLQRLVTRGDEKLRSLITGRGRPGRNPKAYVARYNSGIKTLPIGTKTIDDTYWLELHPDYAARRNLQPGDPVRITSYHGTIVGRVSLNDRVPPEFPFLDFVPGEANRLTDYLDADRFTNQSLIKRTPIRVERLSPQEATLWQTPDLEVLGAIVGSLYQHYLRTYPTETEADAFARGEPDVPDWLPLDTLRQPTNPKEEELAVLVGAMATFLQCYEDNPDYRTAAAIALRQWQGEERDRFLTILLPLLRKLDYNTLMMSLLSDTVGKVPLQNTLGKIEYANLEEAHDSATIEIKEEVVGVQL
ncbi:MAG: molybdopterin oxidoreductase family protein, partial [Spirulina sp.]